MKKAYSVCLPNCLRLHGAQGENEDVAACARCASRKPEEDEHQNRQRTQVDRNPSFLKKMAKSTMSTLKLPLSFVRGQVDRLDGSVILEGPSRGKWTVELQGSFQSCSLNFGQGWEKFVADHVLQVDDLLTFSLSAKSYFQVEVYDGGGCLKTSALDAEVAEAARPVRKVVEAARSVVDVAKPVADLVEAARPVVEVVQAARSVAEVAEAARFVARVAEVEVEVVRSVAGVAEAAKSVGGVAEAEVEVSRSVAEVAEAARSVAGVAETEVEAARSVAEIAEAEVVEAARSEGLDDPSSGDGSIKLAKSDQGGLLPEHRVVRGNVLSKRRLVTELEKERALQAAESLELANPNILLVMSKQNVYKGFWLGIPKQFAKEWMPSENNKVKVVNKGGHSWSAKWIAGRGGLSMGWRRFSLDHRLEEHDVCVFELIDKANYVLLVHIFRVLWCSGEDLGLYPPTLSPDKRNTRRPFNSHEADGTPGEGLQRKSSRRAGRKDKHTLEPDLATEFLRHKSGLLGDDMASPGDVAVLGSSGTGEQGESRAAEGTPTVPQQSLKSKNGLLGDDMASPGDTAALRAGSEAEEQDATRAAEGTSTAPQQVLTRINFGQDGHKADGTTGEKGSSERKKKRSRRDVEVGKHALEPDLAMESLKRKRRLLEDDKASPAKGKELASPDHEEIGTSDAELLVNIIQIPVDQVSSKNRAGGAGDEVALRASGAGAEAEPQPVLALICYENGSGVDHQHEEHSSSARANFFPEVHYIDPDKVHEQILHVPVTCPFKGMKNETRQEHKVVHIYGGRNFGNGTEFLTEFEGYSESRSFAHLDRDDDTGIWWVPYEQFGWDMMRCYIG